MEPILKLVDIKTYFSVRKGFFKTLTVKAVDGVSMTISKGEIVAIVGESGSGKTTLGRTAVKLIEPTSGKIVFKGSDITNIKGDIRWIRKEAQIIFQDPFSSLNPYMTIKQILEEPLIIHGVKDVSERREIILKTLSNVRLSPPEEFILKFPHMLSGGQRQRVCIARALVLNPSFIVADEPVSMIDASSRAEILLLFRELQEKYGIGMMYITHDIATAKYFSHNIGVMYLGKIVEYGSIREVLKNPLHPYTVALINAIPDPDPENRFRERPIVPGEPPSPINPPTGCRFHPRCPKIIDGKCNLNEPTLREVCSKHFVACHLY
ncbi:MAG: ABC transporter ATP-binding protein [Candidatus Methanomethylicia archaeon]